jgi:hypothetical protein
MEEKGMDEQSGFRASRGTIDSLITTSIGLQKRKENDFDTWVLFVDLVKAFDTLPRGALFALLRRYGLPNHFMNIIIRLQKNAKIKVEIGSVDSEIESSIEVRQGSCEGPVLFLFIMQAALETMNGQYQNQNFALVRTELPWVKCTERKRGTIKHEHGCSLYADNAGPFFNTRDDLEMPSKTEAMFFPPPRRIDSFSLSPVLCAFSLLEAVKKSGEEELGSW